jgi:hypothetical protein
MASFLKAAETFTQILTVYERFPHRNALLGRKDTVDEIEYNRTGKIPEHKLKKYGLKYKDSLNKKPSPSINNKIQGY